MEEVAPYETWKENHGHCGKEEWPLPKRAVKCDEANRADQGNHIPRHEYVDSDDVLRAKMEAIADLIKRAKCCTVYTGAGLSRAAGIGDYASKGVSNSLSSTGAPKLKSALLAKPTYAHRVIAALEKKGYVHHYVQQNHDGLPQKAGFPQKKMNEIHGAWYDPSNPVVKFSGSLRTDLFEDMVRVEKKTDLCLCLGTSLSGMNADRCAETPAKRMMKGKKGVLGTVIINLQQTRLDTKCAVRVWGVLDRAFEILAELLELNVVNFHHQLIPNSEVVPYDENGRFDPHCRMRLDLSDGATIRITNPHAVNAGEEGFVRQRDREGNLRVCIGGKNRVLGRWWMLEAIQGAVDALPVVNVDPQVQRVEEEYTVPEHWVLGEPAPYVAPSLR